MTTEELNKVITDEYQKALAKNGKDANYLRYAKKVDGSWLIDKNKLTSDQELILSQIMQSVMKQLDEKVTQSEVAERLSIIVNNSH